MHQTWFNYKLTSTNSIKFPSSLQSANCHVPLSLAFIFLLKLSHHYKLISQNFLNWKNSIKLNLEMWSYFQLNYTNMFSIATRGLFINKFTPLGGYYFLHKLPCTAWSAQPSMHWRTCYLTPPMKIFYDNSKLIDCSRIKHQNRPDQTRPDQTKPDHIRPDQTRPDQTRPDQTRPDHTRPDHTRPHQTTPDHTRPHQTTPDHTRPHQTRPDQTRPGVNFIKPFWCKFTHYSFKAWPFEFNETNIAYIYKMV